jgi:hypothetical protein
MKENRPKHKPFAVSIGAEEHRRLKILSAELRRSMTDVMNSKINELWDHFKRKDNNAHGTEKAC